MLNYHEMTMDEAKDSPQKKKQFAVTCTIMGGVIVYMLMTSGAFQAVAPIEGKFPGGNYVYKYTARDYASSGGLGRAIMEDLINTKVAREQEITPQYKLEEQIHHIYLENPSGRGGSRQRYMSGLLIPRSNKDDDSLDLLLGLNDETKKGEFTKDELHKMSAIEVFQKLPYEEAVLPPVDALVLQFPWTGGISSMLVQSMKVRTVMIVDCRLRVGNTQTTDVEPPEGSECRVTFRYHAIYTPTNANNVNFTHTRLFPKCTNSLQQNWMMAAKQWLSVPVARTNKCARIMLLWSM